MKTCLNCKSSLAVYSNDNFCRECGSVAVEEAKCASCGENLNIINNFCGKCGYPVGQPAPQENAKPPHESDPEPENPVYPDDDEDAMKETEAEYEENERLSHIHL